VTIEVKVTPRARRTAFAGQMADGTLKIQVAAPPEEGRANEELCAFLARHHGVPRSAVEILRGHTSRRKVVRIVTS
jgi:uncharacterized protein (TIGR00251 family)